MLELFERRASRPPRRSGDLPACLAFSSRWVTRRPAACHHPVKVATSEAAAKAAEAAGSGGHQAPPGARARLRVFLSADATEEMIATLKPAVVVQAASAQSASVIARV